MWHVRWRGLLAARLRHPDGAASARDRARAVVRTLSGSSAATARTRHPDNAASERDRCGLCSVCVSLASVESISILGRTAGFLLVLGLQVSLLVWATLHEFFALSGAKLPPNR
ncbi:hypothetical protein PF007_g5189 [Phytophthora fragariae]|uniref:Uncharacterized protein n=1 Tax=Phytophthora fragariae TaxID=53985 RepID=A0A6A3T337_9STRA|nr:hypothetical protein PF007_g5189 [Phytophthora fragariae]